MKLLDRFRKIIMRFIFPRGLPARGRSPPSEAGGYTATARRRSCDRSTVETPKTSCSSSYNYYYSSNSHYNEAIADCIEFFNKSSQLDGVFSGRNSDVVCNAFRN
ncbi:UNVERIFIED_CONTAM: hypothetical protein Sangu_2303300 [Sesamum angustifolium]|uniref:Uncharacterized protein n=1 Tax=Sesamum angustifolium TaxID=2727405 RepID=A0AAW2L7J8_9LAMI